MPFIPNTPESLIARSDSKNPETTCRGITGSGRPCRRPLNASPSTTPNTSPNKQRKRLNQLRVDDPRNPELYCFQHRDQASASAKSSPGPRMNETPILETRESLDTLMDRLGIVEGQQNQSGKNDGNEKIQQHHDMTDAPPQPPRRNTSRILSGYCCCFKIPSFEEDLPSRPKPRPLQSEPTSRPPGRVGSNQYLQPSSASHARPNLANSAPAKQSSANSTTSQTSQYLTLIPPSASPQTASLLMAELAKPISKTDEAGYIYIFWLTPESQPAAPAAETARSLLAPPSGRPRSTSDVLESFAARGGGGKGGKGSKKKTVLLKIGRANNVQRRLNEWTRQCGYNISLIRYYPYVSSSTPSTPRKMPHSHKVERLIHLELAGAGLRISDRENCESCGRAHKEWFEVEANRQGLEMVDEVVRRWSDWDESRG